MEEIVKKVSEEKRHTTKKFNRSTFKKLFGMWLVGGLLALLPIGLVFLSYPIEKLTLWKFFKDIELIYVCVTMSTVMMCDLALRKIDFLFCLDLLLIVVGSSIYGLLKGGASIPILNYANNRSVFSMIFLGVVLALGLISYTTMSFDEEGISG